MPKPHRGNLPPITPPRRLFIFVISRFNFFYQKRSICFSGTPQGRPQAFPPAFARMETKKPQPGSYIETSVSLMRRGRKESWPSLSPMGLGRMPCGIDSPAPVPAPPVGPVRTGSSRPVRTLKSVRRVPRKLPGPAPSTGPSPTRTGAGLRHWLLPFPFPCAGSDRAVPEPHKANQSR